MQRSARLIRFSQAWWNESTVLQPDTGCLVWRGFVDKWGYARVSVEGKGGILAHRLAYECAYGPFDPEMKVCHSCDNPSCMNPEHLFLGTQLDNMHDMFAKGRARPNGRTYLGNGQFSPAKPLGRRRPKHPDISPAPVPSASTDTTTPMRSVKEVDCIHLTRTKEPIQGSDVLAAGWRHVTGVPQSRKLLASVSEQIPQAEAAQPVTAP